MALITKEVPPMTGCRQMQGVLCCLVVFQPEGDGVGDDERFNPPSPPQEHRRAAPPKGSLREQGACGCDDGRQLMTVTFSRLAPKPCRTAYVSLSMKAPSKWVFFTLR